ncbi:MAG: PDZ domain-containing protein [Bacteroidota bacterium]
MPRSITWFVLLCSLPFCLNAQETRLLRQPTLSADRIAFTHGGDVWTAAHDGSDVRRITSTPAVEVDPHFSPDGEWIAFSSDRTGAQAVYVVPTVGGMPTRLTWHPANANVRGWTPDGKNVLYASTRETAPVPHNYLWTVPATGGPSVRISAQWGYDGAYAPNGRRMVLDRMSRWDGEWRAYRGGQNTPLIILDLKDNSEVLLPNEKTTDIQPLWHDGEVYFLSDRDFTMNVWAYNPRSQAVRQITEFTGSDVKWLAGNGEQLMIEREGYLHFLDPESGAADKVSITITGDFPWAAAKWEDVSSRAGSVSLSPTGKRAVMASRGEIFTVPAEHGDSRNITQSSDAADRAPLWSPKGDKIAWFSDEGGKYTLRLAGQNGRGEVRTIDIGESKMAWSPTWSPDGKHLAFVDDDVRVRLVNLEAGTVSTLDVGTSNIDRTRTRPAWSPDSKYLAYVKSGSNNFRQITVWNSEDQSIRAITNPFADAFSPAWDRDKKHLYFLAATDLALGSGWANTSAMGADPEYTAYVVVLRADEDSPFIPRSDEEEVKEEKKEDDGEDEKEETEDKEEKEAKQEEKKDEGVRIDFDGLERRIIALPVGNKNFVGTAAGPAGMLFLAERKEGSPGVSLQKFTLKDREAKEFAAGVRNFSISANGEKIILRAGPGWKVASTKGPSAKSGKSISPKLMMKLDPRQEWKQMFEEAWRYERDYFYDPNLHGRDWNVVYQRYAPLVEHVRHRADLSYILDQVNGELSVGHSFVFGGDFPDTDRSRVGLLGADLVANNGRWQIQRIYTTESWNPRLSSPLDRPGLDVREGAYLVGINGQELTADQDPYEFLDGTVGLQTTLHLNDEPSFTGHREEIVEPIRSENGLRQRAWVEDNRRRVNELSGGRLAYVWVPNTSGNGYVSFNRYFFAQQDKEGAVIDERFNGGGLLDDYMVDLMTRSLRAAITNEVPGGKPFLLPAGILGPKALLINERAGSGGDFFPWAFRHQNAGPLIGATTWGGLVKSSVHYGLVDGGALTAPDNAVFDPEENKYIGENVGIAPDIPVRQDAKALEAGGDPQLERAVSELLKLLPTSARIDAKNPPYPTPAKRN